jgi:hypothetical protein
VWAILGAIAAGRSDRASVALALFIPLVILSMVAHLSLGWAFFVRWNGLDGIIFLSIAVLYGLIEMGSFLTFVLGSADSEYATLIVLIPRILLACGFIALICSSDDPRLKVSEPMYWPGATAVVPRYRLIKLPGIIGAGITSVLAMISQFDKISLFCRSLGICH